MAIIIGTADADDLNDTSGNDNIDAMGGNDTVTVTNGDDIADGGDGLDGLVVDYADATADVSTTVNNASNNYTFDAGDGRSVFATGFEAFDITTGSGNDRIVTFSLDGGVQTSGDDIISTGAGNDIIYSGAGNDEIDAGAGDDRIFFSTGNDTVLGGAGNDTVTFNMAFDGNNTINLGEGADRIIINGNDDSELGAVVDTVYLDFDSEMVGDGVTEDGEGDLGVFMYGYESGGESGPFASYADDEGTLFVAGAGVDLELWTGEDWGLFGAAWLGTAGADTMTATAGSTADWYLNGGQGADVLDGANGDDFLDGGAGNDQMRGGQGDDTYVYTPGDFIGEFVGGGTDTVMSAYSYNAVVNIENIVLTGSADINANGNTLQNQILGNDGDNVINGGGGNDFMWGGLGDDYYFVTEAGDIVSEDSSLGFGFAAGIDTVATTLSYSLGVAIENLNLIGSGNINGTGNTEDNVINGNSGNNVLNGGVGADTMAGAGGNDTYVVDNDGDVVIEAFTTGGIDTVVYDVIGGADAYTLGANVENFRASTNITADLFVTGNALANVITGGAGADVIDGMAGADILRGGDGDDTYYVDNVGDKVQEFEGDDGDDTVISTVSFALGVRVENLMLDGSADINGTGNTLDNVITGNSGANLINGGGGADTMIGGEGDDIYIIDDVDTDGGDPDTGDAVVELGGGGTDEVRSVNVDLDLTTFANVENARLLGSEDLDITGSADDNALNGNAGDNVINAGDGADIVNGGAGDDVLNGEAGDDIINGGSGVDTLNGGDGDDLLAGVDGNDTLNGGAGIDTLLGGAGNDILNGDDGADILVGGLGEDTLTGGLGADEFVFTSAADSSPTAFDTITDFADADGDTIDISAMGEFELVDAFTGTAGELTISYNGAFTSIRGDIDGDGFADFRIDLTGDLTGELDDTNIDGLSPSAP